MSTNITTAESCRGYPLLRGKLTSRGVSFDSPIDDDGFKGGLIGACYGPRHRTQRKLVPYSNILWAEPVEDSSRQHGNAASAADCVKMTYAHQLGGRSSTKFKVATVVLHFGRADEDGVLLDGKDEAPLTFAVAPEVPGRASTNSTSRLVEDEEQGLENVGIDSPSPSTSQDNDKQFTPLATQLLSRAYHGCKKQKRLLVLINSHSGQGKALNLYSKFGAPFFEAARCKTTVIVTKGRHHATEIAETLDLSQYDAIVCCSGDGIPHEVLNGLAKRPDGVSALKSMPLCQFPCGSGNSLAMSLNGNPSTTLAALNIIKGFSMPVDLMCLTQGSTKAISFLSQTYGLVADCDLGTENLRWMGGARFAVGGVMRALAKAVYPCEIAIKYSHKTKEEVARHYSDSSLNVPGLAANATSSKNTTSSNQSVFAQLKYGTINDSLPSDWHTQKMDDLNFFYVGKMPWMASDALVFPASLPSDGTLDLVTWDSAVGRFKCVDLLTQLEKGHHIHNDKVHYAKIEAYRLYPKIPSGYLSIDGESFPFEPFQVEVLRGAGCFLSSLGSYADTCYDVNR